MNTTLCRRLMRLEVLASPPSPPYPPRPMDRWPDSELLRLMIENGRIPPGGALASLSDDDLARLIAEGAAELAAEHDRLIRDVEVAKAETLRRIMLEGSSYDGR